MTEHEHYLNYVASGYDPEDARFMAAQSLASFILAAAGWKGPESTGRDIEDPLLMTSPAGVVISIGPEE